MRRPLPPRAPSNQVPQQSQPELRQQVQWKRTPILRTDRQVQVPYTEVLEDRIQPGSHPGRPQEGDVQQCQQEAPAAGRGGHVLDGQLTNIPIPRTEKI